MPAPQRWAPLPQSPGRGRAATPPPDQLAFLPGFWGSGCPYPVRLRVLKSPPDGKCGYTDRYCAPGPALIDIENWVIDCRQKNQIAAAVPTTLTGYNQSKPLEKDSGDHGDGEQDHQGCQVRGRRGPSPGSWLGRWVGLRIGN